MNNSDQIARNSTVTFLSGFSSVEIYRRGNYIVLQQSQKSKTVEVVVPCVLAKVLAEAVIKAGG
jgi:hypothetical protein